MKRDSAAGTAHRTSRWGLPDAVAGYLAGIVGSITGTWIAAAIVGSTRLSLAVVAGGLLGLWVGYVGTIAVVVRRKGTGSLRRDLTLELRLPRDVALGVAAGAGASLLVVPGIYGLLRLAGVLDADTVARLDRPAHRLVDRAGAGPGALVLFVLIAVGAPIVEECFFRGFLQPAALGRFNVPGGLGITALFFALAHQAPVEVPGLFAFGLVVGVLAWRTGRLGSGIVAHATFNALTLLRLFAHR